MVNILFLAALLKDVKFAQYILKGVIGACKFALHPGLTEGVPSDAPGIGMIVGSGAKDTALSSLDSVLPECQELPRTRGSIRLQVKLSRPPLQDDFGT